ncbi:hypothetical protein L3X38_000741 [Prunus dulcis]|uniref:Uncharacterized protein n=1 Tax=Prunus dulcis TaxID=3755 RepID=A0AAD4WS99_PRUDU|nr:hypothetical protein L3X38_000741 [Prunus dulcis]
MKEYGVTESWSRLYSINLGPDVKMKPSVVSKNGKMVLLKIDYDIDEELDHRLSWYDLKKKRLKEVEISGLAPQFTTTIFWDSLCLLDGDPIIVERQAAASSLSRALRRGKEDD